nr:hypothetical protein [Tanacetum cinerariifolium]
MKSGDAEVKNTILTPGEEKKRRHHQISEMRKKNSDNICEEKIMAILKGRKTRGSIITKQTLKIEYGDDHLDTIPKTKSDDVIKSSVEDVVPISSESEGIFDDTCDVPFCDNSPPLDVLNDHFEFFSDFNDDCTSCDDFSPINIFEKESVTFSNPLFNSNDDSPLVMTSHYPMRTDINPLFDEVLEDTECKNSYDSNLDESTLLVTPLFDVNEDECFDPGGDIDEINDFEDGYYDSKGDLYLESLLSDDTTPSLPSEVFLDHDSKSLKDEIIPQFSFRCYMVKMGVLQGASGNSDDGATIADGAGKIGVVGISRVEVVGDTCLSSISVSNYESSEHKKGKTIGATDTGGGELFDGSASDDE